MKSKGWSKSALAAAVGIHSQNINRYLKGKSDPRKIIINLIPHGLNPEWARTGEGEMYESDEKKSYLNACKKAEKGGLNDIVSESEALYQYPPGPMTKALGKAMCIEKIQEGDDIFLDIGANAQNGDLVLILKNDIPTIERYKPGDPKPYAVCNRLMRNLKPAKTNQEL
jgi:transcriptional regulator with XRE-family HTH domain